MFCHDYSSTTAAGGSPRIETWKRHIIRQLKYRNRTQTSVFQDLIESLSVNIGWPLLKPIMLVCSSSRSESVGEVQAKSPHNQRHSGIRVKVTFTLSHNML
uniref:Uncharacterized protein n=1 Tax=Cyprinus carpio TaxID=7962 RepID=A0A8C1Z342_CYPCA